MPLNSSITHCPPRSKFFYQIWPLFIALIMVFVLFIKAFGVPAPIFSSDEYAYWRHGVLLGNRVALYEADPHMQQINNKAYCMLLSACNRLSPGNLILPSLLNTAAWTATLVVIFFTARHLMRTRDAALAVAATSLLPSGLIAGTLMPDVLFGLGFWLILYIIVRNLSLLKEAVAVFSLLAVLLAIKPHAIALIGSYFLYLIIRISFSGSSGFAAKLRKYAQILGLAAVVFGVTHMGIEGFFPDVDNSANAGFGNIYNNIFKKSMSLDFLLQNIWAFANCLASHVFMLMMLFGLPLAYIVLSSFKFQDISSLSLSERSRSHICFSLITLITLLFVLIMVVIFSIFAGLSNEFEQSRLHLRYYWYLLPAFIVAGFAVTNYLSVRSWLGRLAGGISILGLITYQTFVRNGIRIYPWDCPDIFALYNSTISSWGHRPPIPFTEHIIVTSVLLAGIIMLFRPRLAWILGMIVLCITLSLSWINVLDWQRGVSREHASRLDKARSLGLLLGNARIQAIGSNRYGPFTASLFGLAGNPLVSILPKQTIESSDILPNAEAVLIEGPHEFMGSYAWKVADNTIAIYALIDRSGFTARCRFPEYKNGNH
jgi:hypothetical protein